MKRRELITLLAGAQSLARPGGNITGFSSYDAPIMRKSLQLLKEVAPSVTHITVIFNDRPRIGSA